MRKRLLQALALITILVGGVLLFQTTDTQAQKAPMILQTIDGATQTRATCGRACGTTCTETDGVCSCTGPCNEAEEISPNANFQTLFQPLQY